MKTTIQIIILLAMLAGGGYYGFQQYRTYEASKALLVAKASEAAHKAVTVKEAQEFAKQQAAQAAVRSEVEGALKALKVSSIMPGQPGIVIIDKQEYAEGDQLSLRNGKKVQVTKVQDDGVVLAYNGLTFRLDPPGAPDLAASRKPR